MRHGDFHTQRKTIVCRAVGPRWEATGGGVGSVFRVEIMFWANALPPSGAQIERNKCLPTLALAVLASAGTVSLVPFFPRTLRATTALPAWSANSCASIVTLRSLRAGHKLSIR